MESGKLDIECEAKGLQEPVATYKPIPEDDSVLLEKILPKEGIKMAKHNGDTDIEDGAQELMLKDSGKINSNKEAGEVKFVPENGDAKIDIENVKQALTGITKEELMKFANDPFWIRLRWFMFVAFWLLWAAMLAGAIAIIVMAPKCTAPEPKKVWQKSPIVRLDPWTMPAGLKEIVPKLETLQTLNIKVISIASILKRSLVDGSTIDFHDIDPKLGNIEDFKALVKAAHDREQEIVLEVDPNHTSLDHPWFDQSVQRINNFTDYYVWRNGRTETETKEPNNWVSVYNGSAWEWNEKRGQYYLHQFNKTQPDLNYNNPLVVDRFSDALKFWIKLGVNGFRLTNTEYLLENLEAGDEGPAAVGAANANSYAGLSHTHTYNVQNNSIILRKWRQVVANLTENKGLFSLQGDIGNDVLEVFNDDSILVDLPQKSKFLYTANDNISAVALQIGVNNSLPTVKVPEKTDPTVTIKEAWPAWDLNGQQEPLQKRLSAEIGESLTLMTLLLPGTPILSIDQTEYKNDTFIALVKARKEPAFLHGITKTNVINGTVFVYTRLKHGNPGYLVAYQSGNESANVDLSKLDSISDEVTVIALSSNYHEKDIAVKSRIPSSNVPVSPKSTLVVQFAPQEK